MWGFAQLRRRTCTDSLGSTWMVMACFCQLTASSTTSAAEAVAAVAASAAPPASSVCNEKRRG